MNEVVFSGVPSFGEEYVRSRWNSPTPPAFVDLDRLARERPKALAYFASRPLPTPVLLRLRFLQLLSAGTDHVDLKDCRCRGIRVATIGGANAATVAEHTVLLMLALLRRLDAQQVSVREGHWQELVPALGLGTLAGRTVGVVGLGNIGARVAELVHAFGASIVYYDVVPKASLFTSVAFERLLRVADIVTFHVPLTAQTIGMLDGTAVTALRPGTLVINTSRGGVVDEEALAEALRLGHIGGAALDVFVEEPPDHVQFVGIPNLVVTPHRAGSSLESWRARLDVAVRNMDCWRAGAEPMYCMA
jgi:phosphoglycerate dehydrogenase-like enzyme